jgi:hypothetical protein
MKRVMDFLSPAKVSQPSESNVSSERLSVAADIPEAKRSHVAIPSPARSASFEDSTRLYASGSDDCRTEAVTARTMRRIEEARELFDSILNVQNGATTTDEFLTSLSDGSYIVQLLQVISGVTDRPNKLASLGPAGIVAENFDRYVAGTGCPQLRAVAVLLTLSIHSQNQATCHNAGRPFGCHYLSSRCARKEHWASCRVFHGLDGYHLQRPRLDATPCV